MFLSALFQPDFNGGFKSKTKKGVASQVPLPSLEESISFPKLLAALPRWILASRTPFAGFLAKTFHIHRCGSSPASVISLDFSEEGAPSCLIAVGFVS